MPQPRWPGRCPRCEKCLVRIHAISAGRHDQNWNQRSRADGHSRRRTLSPVSTLCRREWSTAVFLRCPVLFHETDVGTSCVRTGPGVLAAYHQGEVPGPGRRLRQRMRLASAHSKPLRPCISSTAWRLCHWCWPMAAGTSGRQPPAGASAASQRNPSPGQRRRIQHGPRGLDLGGLVLPF